MLSIEKKRPREKEKKSQQYGGFSCSRSPKIEGPRVRRGAAKEPTNSTRRGRRTARAGRRGGGGQCRRRASKRERARESERAGPTVAPFFVFITSVGLCIFPGPPSMCSRSVFHCHSSPFQCHSSSGHCRHSFPQCRSSFPPCCRPLPPPKRAGGNQNYQGCSVRFVIFSLAFFYLSPSFLRCHSLAVVLHPVSIVLHCHPFTVILHPVPINGVDLCVRMRLIRRRRGLSAPRRT